MILQGVVFHVDIYHLDISGADLVLGMAWLQSLGRVLTYYNLLIMEFVHNGSPTILYDENLSYTDPIKGGCVYKLFLSENVSSLCHLHILDNV